MNLNKLKKRIVIVILLLLLICLISNVIADKIVKQQENDLFCHTVKNGMTINEVKNLLQKRNIKIQHQFVDGDYINLYATYNDPMYFMILIRRRGVLMVFYNEIFQEVLRSHSVSEYISICPENN